MIWRSNRRGAILLILLLFTFLVFLHRSRYLIALLFENGGEDAVYPSTILSPASEININSTQLIPKIIHQTYKTTVIPEHWRAGQQAVIDLHPDWEYMVPLLHSFCILMLTTY